METKDPSVSGAAVHLRGVGKRFADRAVFESVDLTIAPGDFVSLVGASGCGKSTFLRLIAGLETATDGEVALQPARPSVSYVFQEAHLLPWRSIAANVALPLELQGVPPAERGDRVMHVLAQVGMAREADRFPSQLSGGMKMRVSLARALVTSPSLLLLDEPFAALDELSRVQLEEELRSLWSQKKMTVVLVTHSFSEAVFLSERVVLLSAHQRGIGGSLPVALGERNEAARRSPEFARLVHQCRLMFEQLQKGTSK